MACWLRWVAMSRIGGLLTDYDVLSNGYNFGESLTKPRPLILSDNNPVPCAVLGTKEQYQTAIDAFVKSPVIQVEQGKRHSSDQLAVQSLRFPAVDICREFGKDGWREAKLIHFSHAACKMDRSIRMGQWVNEPHFCIQDIQAHVEEERIEVQSKIEEALKNPRLVMDEIRERLVWIKKNSRGITRHHVHRELEKLGLLPKK